MKAYVLLSGGIDSMSCVNFYKTLGYEVECIFCDYGQPASIPEKQASKKIAAYFEVPYETIEVRNINIPQCGEICGRNALLVWTAFSKIGFGTYKIVLGTHAGTEYPDCSSRFSNNLSTLFDMRTTKMNLLESNLVSKDMTIKELLDIMEV